MSEVLHYAIVVGEWILVGLVLVAVLPVVSGSYQMVLAVLFGWRNHYGQCALYYPRVAILLPAWNEAAVIEASIERLMRLEYPVEALRVYVIDDGSTDATPDIVRAKERAYPGRVWLLRREHGGEGKAHTLNFGLERVLAEPWMQALLIMDADVIYPPSSLRMLARHLADPEVGAVTAYIQEGTRPGNYLNRVVGYEYITAQAAARRGQNVLGALACLAGGAQLHARDSLEAIGGRIDTSSLAEDTFTTFNVQLAGRRAVFDPHVIVVAEEPDNINGLWKQRLRWARGNIQVTLRFADLFFRRTYRHGLGGLYFGVSWFCLLLQPVFMVLAAISLITLFFVNRTLASQVFHALWITTALTYVLIVLLSIAIDPITGRRVWFEAVTFPGLISLAIILYALFPFPVVRWVSLAMSAVGLRLTDREVTMVVLFTYAWVAASMLVAWWAKTMESRRGGRWLSRVLLFVAGYGPMLCAVNLHAYLKEAQGAEMVWEKTEKSGKAQRP